MRRGHFYIMGAIATVWGLLCMAEYVLISYGLRLGWLDMYPAEQLDWLASIPGWVHGLWGAQAVLALAGALCLLAHLRPAVWMLGLAFIAMVVLSVWMHLFAEPTLFSLAGGWISIFATALAVALSGLIWLYARGEKQTGEVL